MQLRAWAIPGDRLRAAGCDDSERRDAAAQREGRCGGGRAARSRRTRGAYAALEDANFDLAVAHDTHKLDVGVVGEIAMSAYLRAEAGPGAVTDGVVRIFDEEDEVRIAGGNFEADDFDTVNELERVRYELWHTH